MNLIVAADRNWGIGRDNGLLASLPGDMKYFREHTMGKAVVMGRRTLESMPGGRGLPNRVNIVMTTNRSFTADRCIIVHDEKELWAEIRKQEPDVFLIGGATMYNKYYRFCDRLYITKMDADLNADTFIVNIDEDDDFRVVSESEVFEENGVKYRFLVYEKRTGDNGCE